VFTKTTLLVPAALISWASAAEPAPLAKAAGEMAAAASAFLISLNDEQTQKARLAFDDEERENFHFVPKPRKGIPFADLSPEQKDLSRKLLAAGMSEKGLLKVETIIALESLLAEKEKNPTFRDAQKYHTTIFGNPGPDATWAWRFEGHHLSVNFTIVAGKSISATPSFLGANPAEVRGERLRGTRPLAAEEDLARTLATALNDASKPVIYTEKPPNDILTGADRIAKQLDPVGIQASEMTDAQRTGLLDLITQYTHRHRAEIAAKDLEKIKADLPNIRFAWAGSLKKGDAYYYRIQGKSFLIEAANVQTNANHIHTVWRDLEGDFARDALGEHHRNHDH
jgi:hypothetical protein